MNLLDQVFGEQEQYSSLHPALINFGGETTSSLVSGEPFIKKTTAFQTLASTSGPTRELVARKRFSGLGIRRPVIPLCLLTQAEGNSQLDAKLHKTSSVKHFFTWFSSRSLCDAEPHQSSLLNQQQEQQKELAEKAPITKT
ncbi:unnamed protein product [Protopolystoma xenopodis]|uniref:Uncharacterized protein n=1 Tax=Protopolystoma xenopodis TaxID=117903 RepID=A0A448WWI3_9PLAT|nr:unnamed protein product [Protopolystoma xenopodis]